MRQIASRLKDAARPFLDDLRCSTAPGDDVRVRILAQQIASTTQAMRSVGLFVALLVAAVAIAAWPHSDRPLLLAGVAIVAGASFYSFRKLPLRARPQHVARSVRRHAGTALALGIGWTAMTAAMAMDADDRQMLLVVALQIAFVCVGLMLYLSLPLAFLLFGTPVVTVLTIELARSSTDAAVLAIFTPMLMVVLARACVHQSRQFVNAGRTAEALRSAREREHMAERNADDERLRHALATTETAETVARERRAEMLALATRFEGSVVALVDALSACTGEVDAVVARLDGMISGAILWADTIAARTLEAADVTDKVDAAARQLSGGISDITERVAEHARSSDRAHRLVGSSGEWIAAIDGEMARVTGVAGVIETMTSQTKLLALNATIEAARAGERGRGFAVVAQEVKALAHRAGAASREVADGIGDVSTRMASVVAGIRDTATEIDRVAAIAGSIAGSIAGQQGAAERISGDIVWLAAHAGTVRDQIAEFVANSNVAHQLTRDVRAQVGSLTRSAEELRARSGVFLEQLRAA